jgi:hypothetical protein
MIASSEGWSALSLVDWEARKAWLNNNEHFLELGGLEPGRTQPI